jgi:hypothetical protein
LKKYHLDIALSDFLTFPLHFVVVLFLCVAISNYFFPEERKFFIIFYTFSLLIYSLIMFVDVKYRLIPYFPDTDFFYSVLKTGEVNKESLGFKIAFKYLIVPIYWLSFKSIFNFFLFNFLIFQMGFLFIIKAWFNLYKDLNPKLLKFYMVFVTFFPTVIIFTITPLREAYLILSFGLFIYAISKSNAKFALVTSILMTLMFRYQLIIFYLFVFIVIYFYSSGNYKKLGKLTLLIFPLYFAMDYVSRSILNIAISPVSLAAFRNYQRQAYVESGATYPIVNWSNWFDLILDIPFLFFQFLLSPLPIIVRVDFWNKYAYLIDGLFVLLVLLIILLKFKYLFFKYKLWFLLIIAFVLLNSFFEFHFYGAVRHRLPAVLMLIPIFASQMKFKIGLK